MTQVVSEVAEAAEAAEALAATLLQVPGRPGPRAECWSSRRPTPWRSRCTNWPPTPSSAARCQRQGARQRSSGHAIRSSGIDTW